MPPRETRTSRHQPFRFRTAEALLRKAEALGIDLPFRQAVEPLFRPACLGQALVPNRLSIQPMEGYDGAPDGTPSGLTARRYRRYAEGGSGLIWFEATAVRGDGRSNPRALVMTRANYGAFRSLAGEVRTLAADRFGAGHRPYLVLQLTHAGRFSSRGEGRPARIAAPNPHLDPPGGETLAWEDRELQEVGDAFVDCARLAAEAGFDAVDIKACHGYILSELLGAHDRTAGRYGGSLENRARLLLDIVGGVRRAAPGLAVAVRLNVTDMIPFPFGFGMARDGSAEIDISEPLTLVQALNDAGCSLLNVTLGVPRHPSHRGRPFDRPPDGGPVPDEHPLEGVSRMLRLAEAVQRAAGEVPVVGTGYSWLRQYWPHVGAAVVDRGMAAFVGLGRGALAYPDAPRDLMETGRLNRSKCCTACSRCTELMRRRLAIGCAVRDKEYRGSGCL